MKRFPIRSIAVFLTTAALLALTPTASAAGRKAGPMPDLTTGGKPDDNSAVPLGPTGMRGWIYHQHLETSKTRHIPVTRIKDGSQGHGKIELGDVIVGASGSGKNPAGFESDARRRFAAAINDAEAHDPRLPVWRKGKKQVIPMKPRTMGAYSPIAPLDCPKSAEILQQGQQYVFTKENAERSSCVLLIRFHSDT